MYNFIIKNHQKVFFLGSLYSHLHEKRNSIVGQNRTLVSTKDYLRKTKRESGTNLIDELDSNQPKLFDFSLFSNTDDEMKVSISSFFIANVSKS
jgi:hypothetical protein